MRDIFAIDPASKLGWARRLKSHVIDSGVFKLKGMNEERILSYASWLQRCLRFTNHAIVVYETPHQMPGRASSFRVGCHLEATLWAELAHFEGITLLGVAAPSLKKHATGSGRAKKPEVIKAMCKRWGRKITDDNEADALALLSYGLAWEEGNRVIKVKSITR